MIAFLGRHGVEYVDDILSFAGECRLAPRDELILDNGAVELAPPRTLLVGLSGGAHHGDTTLNIEGCELVLEDGSVYR